MSNSPVILHDLSQRRDIIWTTVDAFVSDNADALKRPNALKRQIERKMSLGREFHLEMGAGGNFSLRRAPDISDTVQGFRCTLARIGVVARLKIEEVFSLWTEYSYRSAGQSALLGEFVEWYEDRLGGDRNALREAIRPEASECSV